MTTNEEQHISTIRNEDGTFTINFTIRFTDAQEHALSSGESLELALILSAEKLLEPGYAGKDVIHRDDNPPIPIRVAMRTIKSEPETVHVQIHQIDNPPVQVKVHIRDANAPKKGQ